MTTPTGFTTNSDGLGPDAILQAANTILMIKENEKYRLERIAKYMRGRHDPPYTPKGASTEYRWLVKRSKDNFLPLITQVITQNLIVDGYRPSDYDIDSPETVMDVGGEPGWAGWRANRLVSRQHGIHGSVVKYGSAYAAVVPGSIAVKDVETGGITDKSMAVVTPYSPRQMTALYADDITDEWPIIAVAEKIVNDRSAPGKARLVVTVYDDTNRYILVGATGGTRAGKLAWPAPNDPILGGKPVVAKHNMGVCPVVRYTYEADLDADMECIGEVEPLISLQDQVNFHTFNELLAEQFAAYNQRWASGMVPVDETGRKKSSFKPGVDRLWVNESVDARFGEFSAANLSQIIEARESTIRHMSTISQVPPYHLLGSLVNLSADALAAARNGLDSKCSMLQGVLTDAHRNLFRLISKAQGDQDGWLDLYGAVLWRDTSARSFAATIDGLGKAANMLGVPAAELWRRIPGVTAEDVAAWKTAATRQVAMDAINKVVEAALTAGAMPNGGPVPGGQENQINSAAGLAGLGKEIITPAPGVVGPAQPPGNAAVPPGMPGNETPAPNANSDDGQAGGTHPVEIPAHTRSMPNVPKPKKPKPTAGNGA